MSSIYTLGAVTVYGLTDAALFGLGAGTLAAAGLTAADIAGADGSSFYGYDGSTNGFTNIGSYNQAIVNGAQTNTGPSTGPGSNASQIYNNVYNNAVNSGVDPQQAATYAQQAANNGVDYSGGYNVGAPTSAAGTGAGTTAANAAAGTVAPGVTATGGAVTAGGSTLGTAATVGGAAVAGGALGGILAGGSSPAAGATGTSAAATGSTATTAATAAGGSTLGSTLGTIAKAAPIVTAAGALAGGLSGGTSTSAPNAGSVAGNILQDEINFAPQVYSTTAQYAPQYANLQSQMLGSSTSSVASLYGATAPGLQDLQTSLNSQQASGNVNLLGQYGSSLVSAYQAANPQLQALQNQYTSLAQSNPAPVGQISGAGNWATSFAGGVQQTVGQNQVSGGTNSMANQLNQTASQQLALGTGVSQQEASTVANQVLSNYNSMGRANDPTAIAGLATSLDTYGQNLLNTRESNAATAAGLTTNQNALNLQAQQSNQSAALTGLNLDYSALSSGGAQGLAANQSNQAAQLSNAQYQQSTLGGAATLAQSTAANPLNLLTTGSTSLTQAYNATAQAGTSLQAGQALSGMYNPFNSAAYGPAYTAQANANTTNATTNAGLVGGGLSLLGSISNAAGTAGGYSNLFGSG